MKTCALCQTQADDEAPTCAACGEGTFLPQAQLAPESKAQPEAEEQPVPSKRSKR
jgi:hypothetical protein